MTHDQPTPKSNGQLLFCHRRWMISIILGAYETASWDPKQSACVKRFIHIQFLCQYFIQIDLRLCDERTIRKPYVRTKYFSLIVARGGEKRTFQWNIMEMQIQIKIPPRSNNFEIKSMHQKKSFDPVRTYRISESDTWRQMEPPANVAYGKFPCIQGADRQEGVAGTSSG